MKHRYNISCGKKKCIMSISSIVIVSTICWWCWCVFSFALVSTNIEKGLFHSHAPIKDIKDGSMTSLFSYIHKHSITLVFFYAPWSGQCIKLVPQIVSSYKRINSSLVTIAAINCWIGNCKEKFQTYHFPRLFLYHSSYAPIEYLDDIEADSILNFLQLSVTPWEHIVSSHELQQFIENYDDYFVAYMDVNRLNDDQIYDVFFHSSLLLINRSKRARIAVLTNHTMAAMLQLQEHGDIRSHSVLGTNLYTTDYNYSAEAISRWMNSQTKKIVRVLRPQPDKTSYVNMLKQGPAIILHSSQSAIESGLMQQYLNVALSYHHDCDKIVRRNAYKEKHTKGFCTSFLVNENVCSVCQLCSRTRTRCADDTHAYILRMRDLSKQATQCSSTNSLRFYNNDKFSFCCLDIKGERKWKTKVKSTLMTLLPGNSKKWSILKQISVFLGYIQHCYMNVSRSIQQQTRNSLHQEKNKLSLSSILNEFLDLNNEVKLNCVNSSCPPGHSLSRSFESLINGLACTTNRTLNFFILNYDRYSYLLKHIGLTRAQGEPTLLIVDLVKEEHYMLQREISLSSLSSFILQFTFGRLQQKYPVPEPTANKTGDKVVSGRIVELTSLTFDGIVMTTAKHVLVMFYTLWCGICKVTNLTFLRLVHSYNKEVIFTRIDADAHMLPWQYQPNIYPSFVLFPANRKDHSVSFPIHRPVTLTNLQMFLDDNIP